MKKQIVEVENFKVRDFLNPGSIYDDFMIFDNLSKPIENILFYAITPYPVRLTTNVIIFCKRGFMRINIGFNEYTVSKNHILTILAGQIFQITEITSDFTAGCIIMTNNFFNVQHDFIMAVNLKNIFLKSPSTELSDKEMSEMMQIFNLLKNKISENKSIFLSQIVQHYFRIMFYIICDTLNNQTKPESRTYKEQVLEMFIMELQKHFKREHTVQFYADRLSMTAKNMSAIIYEVSEKHPRDWIKDYIILESKALLKTTTMTIQQISDEFNFLSQSHFGKYFKQSTGYSPKEYRKIKV
ncbi:MAG: helix-turn-helix domain-containing protein [Bacteroidales bacterium]|jgi:AraC-like DNA-binding protein|nr:helix-turn-helix domain-containing protein [Bacteroidales bacterium]